MLHTVTFKYSNITIDNILGRSIQQLRDQVDVFFDRHSVYRYHTPVVFSLTVHAVESVRVTAYTMCYDSKQFEISLLSVTMVSQ